MTNPISETKRFGGRFGCGNYHLVSEWSPSCIFYLHISVLDMYLELYRKKTAQKATDLFLVSMLIIAHKSRIQERYYTIYIARLK